MERDSAYVGLGFSIDKSAETRTHVVMGCSHIYTSEGLGLKYRLSKVEEPLIRNGNPFMSREDARRTGDNIRQLFFDATNRLPSRVVIHKRTPFLRDEREGLLEGLADIPNVEMIEINHYCPAKTSGSHSNSLKISTITHGRSKNDLDWKGAGLTSFRLPTG